MAIFWIGELRRGGKEVEAFRELEDAADDIELGLTSSAAEIDDSAIDD